MKTVIITRHSALIQLIDELGLAPAGTPVLTHASPDDVAGMHVIGVLPLSLAALAEKVTEIPMAIPAELRGVELTIEQVRLFAGRPTTYRVDVI